MTEALSLLEGMERGPAGNTSLAAAFSMAQELPEDFIIVVQESEYTGAGKHFNSQIAFAKSQGITLTFGHPLDEKPGKNLVFPTSGSLIKHKSLDMNQLKMSYLKRYKNHEFSMTELKYLEDELRVNQQTIIEMVGKINES